MKYYLSFLFIKPSHTLCDNSLSTQIINVTFFSSSRYVCAFRMVRMIGDEFLTEERDRKYYADHYTCCPPPLFIILITLVEVSR